MSSMIRAGVLTTLCCVLLLTGLCAVAQENMVEVNPSDPDAFQTIQAAIDSAGQPDNIVIHAGTYHENLVIERPVSLLGIVGAILSPADRDHPTLSVRNADDVGVHGLMIEDAKIGIRLTGSSGRVMYCEFRHCETGITAMSIGRPTLFLCGLDFLGDSTGVGVEILGQGTTTIMESSFSGLATGIVIGGQAEVSVTGSIIEFCFDGLSVVDTASLELTQCRIRDNLGSGVLLHAAPVCATRGSLFLLDNQIEGNGSWGISACGSQVARSDYWTFHVHGLANDFANNRAGDACPIDLVFEMSL